LFDKQKFISRGVEAEVALDIQILILQMIEDIKAKKIKIDYLQVFELKTVFENGITLQEIRHHQEVPPYSNNEVFRVSEAIDKKLFFIDSGEYATLILAEEY
jgi:hypothetical protein